MSNQGGSRIKRVPGLFMPMLTPKLWGIIVVAMLTGLICLNRSEAASKELLINNMYKL